MVVPTPQTISSVAGSYDPPPQSGTVGSTNCVVEEDGGAVEGGGAVDGDVPPAVSIEWRALVEQAARIAADRNAAATRTDRVDRARPGRDTSALGQSRGRDHRVGDTSRPDSAPQGPADGNQSGSCPNCSRQPGPRLG